MAEKEPPGSQKPKDTASGTPGHGLGPLQRPFTPDLSGLQRLTPPADESKVIPPPLNPFYPPPSDDVDSVPPSPIAQIPQPKRRIRGIGWGQGTNPNPSTENADSYMGRVSPENRPPEWWKSFGILEPPEK